MLEPRDLLKYLETGATVFSSGTTGSPKSIFRSPRNLAACNAVACRSQGIDRTSSVYTVTRLSHAGGLLAQSLPALSVGARVHIESFNPYSFLKEFKRHTHTFLPPPFMAALMKTKSFGDFDFEGRFILTGSSEVEWPLIEAFVAQNAVVAPNWGMSEIGPLTIMSTFRSMAEIRKIKDLTPPGTTILGDTFYTEYRIQDEELWVRGPLCVYDDWFATGDLVRQEKGILFYRSRKSAAALPPLA